MELKFKNFYKVLTYDIDKTKCNSTKDWVFNQCSYIFVCLPTPMKKDGSCFIGIIEDVLSEINVLKKFDNSQIFYTTKVLSLIHI